MGRDQVVNLLSPHAVRVASDVLPDTARPSGLRSFDVLGVYCVTAFSSCIRTARTPVLSLSAMLTRNSSSWTQRWE